MLDGEPGATAENNFNYDSGKTVFQAASSQCPLSSHIRKVNPRGKSRDPAERDSRIARRGIPYGARGAADVGLLFQCCQSKLVRQFERIQLRWSNQAGSPEEGEQGTDPVTALGAPQNQHWPRAWGSPERVVADFGRFVTMRGGAYFFLPSRPFLENA
jgi:deferrochelatase/peroxidase EfeB